MALLTSSDIHRGKILIVDDQDANVLLLRRILGSAGFLFVESTTDPTDVCRLHRENRYDLILLDLQMPEMDGFEVMEGLKEIEPEGYLPVLVVTAQPSHKVRALEAGAKDFISKPFEIPEVLARVRNMLEVRLVQGLMRTYNETLETRVAERTAALHDSYLETIYTMTRAAEHRDADTGAHVQRISYFSRELATALGLDEAFVDTIFFASPMHDIGKIGIPDSVLLKPGALTPEEWVVMKGHTLIGWAILGDSKSAYLQMGAEIALSHHEQWDGGGYPNGLRSEDIPLSARITSVCDVYDAVRSQRPYKSALSRAAAVDILMHGDDRTRPTQFDPEVLAAFSRNEQTLNDIFESFIAPAGEAQHSASEGARR
ncbi:MAG TPA: HD domain-containing phosphohydrolase [Tepidiformaceae bacterium]